MKRWGIFFVILLFVGIFGYLFFFFGLRQYIGALYQIRQLPAEQQGQARQTFFALDTPDDHEYGGILAGVSRIGGVHVWVWGRSGLRSFRPDEYTVYTYFRVCSAETLMLARAGQVIPEDKLITTDMAEWLMEAKLGEYVVAKVAVEGNGGTMGSLREIYAHGWFAFMPTERGVVCAN